MARSDTGFDAPDDYPDFSSDGDDAFDADAFADLLGDSTSNDDGDMSDEETPDDPLAELTFFDESLSLSRARLRRKFTLDGAGRTLPLVRQIVGDLVLVHGQARSLHARLEKPIDRTDRHAVEAQLDRVVQKLERHVDELAEIGIEVVDYQSGLVDFVARHQGREIRLCWSLGQDRITHWYEVDAPQTRFGVELLTDSIRR